MNDKDYDAMNQKDDLEQTNEPANAEQSQHTENMHRDDTSSVTDAHTQAEPVSEQSQGTQSAYQDSTSSEENSQPQTEPTNDEQQTPYEQNVQYGQNTQYEQNAQYGQSTQYGQNTPYGQNAQYGQNSPYGQNAPYGQDQSSFQNQTPAGGQQMYQQGYYNPAPATTYKGEVVGAPPQEPEKKKRSKGLRNFIIVLLVIAILGGGVGFAVKYMADDTGTDVGGEGNTASSFPIDDTNDEKALSPTEIAEKVRKSVTAVLVYNGGKAVSEGSGVIMSETADGTGTYIITCAHVVSMENSGIDVLTLTGETYAAELVGMNTRSDIAVLKVNKTGLPLAAFGSSDDLKIGETVYAIGNPGGTAFFGSFTGGVVSAIDRPISATSSAYSMKTIQHDAAINPGNSGGALINNRGQVIGINSSKIASDKYEGMAFAIPISTAKPLIDAIVSDGYVANQPRLGLSYAPNTQMQAYALIVQRQNLPVGSIVVQGIESGSDLVNSDLRKGDIVYAVNGEDMATVDVLAKAIESGKVGDILTLSVARISGADSSLTKFTVTAKLIEDKT